ncbi:MBL fold metallo-hydrolase RNA specificity domain-containing protein [Altererythrobacter lutimaris]|uniref:MBL fold metallo-hydrolase RNA specificity domain-containing protein n=1 Tax=Altererythrobacter lutimaris TaxID=2743979 RepID=UPI001E57FC91|nr:MBL fold metallo-hydrolase [Altererythrobacter lutimaris]
MNRARQAAEIADGRCIIVHLTFLGAADTVTGSKFLVETQQSRILVDCGLFQGYKVLRSRNWNPLPVDPASIDAVVLTHAHLDHSGYLPLLVKNGFSGKVFCTKGTRALCGLLLPDSGYLLEADARYANRRGFSKHKPALPLYTRSDALKSLESFIPQPFGEDFQVTRDCSIRFRYAGHILGAATVEMIAEGKRIVFSGDLGRFGDPLMFDPEPISEADYLLIESTYGDRLHPEFAPQQELERIITRTVARGGSVIIPSFAVGRAQALLYHINAIRQRGKLPGIPVYLDSPMACSATDLFCQHAQDHRLSSAQCRDAWDDVIYTRNVEHSKRLDTEPGSKIIISASGMVTGGRILHRLKRYAPDHRSTIVMAGYQAGGTRGAAMLNGAEAIKIHGEYVPVRAEIVSLDMLSAHADQHELLRWLSGFKLPPKECFIVHGEADSADRFRLKIAEKFAWKARVPEHRERVKL